MSDYLVDLRDVQFVLHEQLHLEQLLKYPKFQEFSKEMFEMIVEEGAKQAKEIAAPLGPLGDEQGVKFEGDDGWVFVSRSRLDAEPKSLLEEEIGPNEIHLYPSGDHRRNFLDCMKTRRLPAAPIEHAHRTISIAHLANIAMLLGRKIRWNPAAERIVGDESAARMLRRAMREPWSL